MRFRITPRFCLFLICAMLIAFGISFAISCHDLSTGAQKLEQVQDEYAKLEQQLHELSEDLAYTETDDYIERVARDELGMIRPGEIRYVGSN